MGIRYSVALAVLLGSPWHAPAPAEPPDDGPRFRTASKAAKASAALFDGGVVPEMRIEITPAELKKLRANNRAYVRCTVTESVTAAGESTEATFTDVGIKLKGAVGSFRDLDDRPALTLNMD